MVLGTFGLAAVMIRNILERRRELGLLSALGFAGGRLQQLIAMEHLALLLVGLVIGIGASLMASLPQSLLQGSQGPWSAIAILIACTSVVAALATWFAMRKIQPHDLFKSLLDE